MSQQHTYEGKRVGGLWDSIDAIFLPNQEWTGAMPYTYTKIDAIESLCRWLSGDGAWPYSSAGFYNENLKSR